MKAKFEFNLPEEKYEYDAMYNAMKYKSALEDVHDWFRSQLKYNDKLTDAEAIVYDAAFEKFWDILNENGVVLFD